jgi:hypothetical protein
MQVLSVLAAMDFNLSTSTEQATRRDGEPRFKTQVSHAFLRPWVESKST